MSFRSHWGISKITTWNTLNAMDGSIEERGENMASAAHNRATTKYNAVNTERVYIRLNKKTDADILQYLDSLDNKQGYIKDLIRADIAKKK